MNTFEVHCPLIERPISRPIVCLCWRPPNILPLQAIYAAVNFLIFYSSSTFWTWVSVFNHHNYNISCHKQLKTRFWIYWCKSHVEVVAVVRINRSYSLVDHAKINACISVILKKSNMWYSTTTVPHTVTGFKPFFEPVVSLVAAAHFCTSSLCWELPLHVCHGQASVCWGWKSAGWWDRLKHGAGNGWVSDCNHLYWQEKPKFYSFLLCRVSCFYVGLCFCPEFTWQAAFILRFCFTVTGQTFSLCKYLPLLVSIEAGKYEQSHAEKVQPPKHT